MTTNTSIGITANPPPRPQEQAHRLATAPKPANPTRQQITCIHAPPTQAGALSYRHTRRHKTPRTQKRHTNKNPQNPINLQQHQYRQHTYSRYHIRQYSPIRTYTHHTPYTLHTHSRISPTYPHTSPISPIRTCVFRTMSPRLPICPPGSLYVPRLHTLP